MWLQNGGGTKTHGLRLRIGSTDVLTLTSPGISSNSTARAGLFQFSIVVLALTGSNNVSIDMQSSYPSGQPPVAAALATVDLTSGMTIDVRAVTGDTGGTQEVSNQHLWVEHLRS